MKYNWLVSWSGLSKPELWISLHLGHLEKNWSGFVLEDTLLNIQRKTFSVLKLYQKCHLIIFSCNRSAWVGSSCRYILHTGWFQQQTFISFPSKGWKSQIRVPAGSVSVEASLLSCCCAHKTCTLYAHGEAGSSLAPLPIRAPILSSQTLSLWPHSVWITSFGPHLQIQSHPGLELPQINLGETQFRQ